MGVDVAALLSQHDYSREILEEREGRISWSCFAALLAELERVLGGPRAIEQLGAEIGAAHPVPRAMSVLHFGIHEIQNVLSDRWLKAVLGDVLRPVVSVQPDSTMRITLSLGREYPVSYAFWSLLLGFWRPLPRLFGLADTLIDVEMADRFAEYLLIFPPLPDLDPASGREIRHAARKGLLASLIAYDDLRELPKPNLRSSILEHRLQSAESSELTHPEGGAASSPLSQFARDWKEKLQVERLQLLELSPSGLRRVSGFGGPLKQARIRRLLWLSDQAIGAIEVERPGVDGHSTVASLLDEHIEAIAYRFAELQNRLPIGVSSGGFSLADPVVGDPTIAEPPPSSRGRLARAAREGRLRELTQDWGLTERQRAVLALLVEGLANKEIAARLDCSVGTIENHVTRLFKRASVDCRAALTALFWRTSGRS